MGGLWFLWILGIYVHGADTVPPTTGTREFLVRYLAKSNSSESTVYQSRSDESLLRLFLDELRRPDGSGRKRKHIWFTDLDDTLIESRYLFTSILYRRTKIDETRQRIELRHLGVSKERLNQLLADDFWDFARRHPDVNEVEGLYSHLLRSFQNEVGLAFGLTARPRNMADVTQAQLNSLSLSFSNLQGCGEFAMIKDRFEARGLPGVLFSSHDFAKNHSTKGQTMLEALQIISRCLPADEVLGDVFFVDDQPKELASIQDPDLAIERSLNKKGSLLHLIFSQIVKSRLERQGFLPHLKVVGELQQQVFDQEGRRISNAEALQRVTCSSGLSGEP